MSLYSLTTGIGIGDVPQGAGVTRFNPIAGNMTPTGTEANHQFRARNAWTLSDLWVRVIANSSNFTTTFRSRNNGANDTQIVTFGGGVTGVQADTTNTDSIASGDLFNSSVVTGAGAGTIIATLVSFTIEDTSGDVWPLMGSGAIDSIGRNVQTFVGIGGDIDETGTESNKQYRLREATTFSDLLIRVAFNGISEASECRFRVGGSDGNQVANITASQTGSFEDTTNNDVVSANTLINYDVTSGMGSHTDSTLGWVILHCHGDAAGRTTTGHGTTASWAGSVTNYWSIESELFFDQTIEINTRLAMRVGYDVNNLFVLVTQNPSASASTWNVRKNGANSSVTVTIPGTQTGEFEDTTNTEGFSATDEINHQIVAQGNMNIRIYGILITETPSVEAPPIRPMPQLHPRAARRAAPYSYWRDNLLAVPELDFPPIRPMDQLHPRAAARAAPNDYWIDNLLAVPEQVFAPIRPMTQLHPRAAPRAAPLSYWIDNLLAVEEIPDFPPIRPMPQLHPRAALRGSPLLYWIDNFLAIEEPDNLIRPMPQLLPRAALRASPLSYWLDNLLAIDEPDNLIRPMVQLLPRAALRAAPLSYWLDNLLAIDEPDNLIRPMPQLLPRAALRGSPLLYWIDNFLAVEEFPPVRPMDQLHPRAARRASPLSYWIDNLLAVEELLPPPIRPMDQLHPRAALRAAPLSYWIDNLLAVAEIVAVTFELTYAIDVLIGSPAIGFQEKELILKRILLRVLQLKDLIGPD